MTSTRPDNQSNLHWHQTAMHETILALSAGKLQLVTRFSGNAWDPCWVFDQGPSLPSRTDFSLRSCSFKHASKTPPTPSSVTAKSCSNASNPHSTAHGLTPRTVSPASDHDLESGLDILAFLTISFKFLWVQSHEDNDARGHLLP
jgi:hypothetical protein